MAVRGGEPATRTTLLWLAQKLQAAETIERVALGMWPHDIYRQTCAVMGFDPLPEPVVVTQDDDAANVMPPDDA